MSDDLARLNVTTRDVWKYEPRHAQKYGMPKIEVVFIHDGARGNVRRDPQRTDFTGALPAAIKLPIVSPDLKEAPDWAKFEKQFEEMKTVEAPTTLTRPDGHPLPQAGEGTAERRVRAAGAGRLTLMKDAWVTVKVTISGLIKGERVTFRGEPEEFVPDSIRAFPGCYVVRGGIPLSITLGSYNLTKELKVN